MNINRKPLSRSENNAVKKERKEEKKVSLVKLFFFFFFFFFCFSCYVWNLKSIHLGALNIKVNVALCMGCMYVCMVFVERGVPYIKRQRLIIFNHT